MSKVDFYYTYGSPPCHAVMMLAKAINLNLNLISLDLAGGEHLKEEFLKLNPQHTVPTLVDNGKVLWESRAIMTYLVDKYATTDNLYPKDPIPRAFVNTQLYNDLCLFDNMRNYYAAPLFYGIPANPKHLERSLDSLTVLEDVLSGKGYVAGTEMTVADISLVAIISSVEMIGHDFSPYPNIVKWLAKCKKEIPGYADINQFGLDKLKERIVSMKHAKAPEANDVEEAPAAQETQEPHSSDSSDSEVQEPEETKVAQEVQEAQEGQKAHE